MQYDSQIQQCLSSGNWHECAKQLIYSLKYDTSLSENDILHVLYRFIDIDEAFVHKTIKHVLADNRTIRNKAREYTHQFLDVAESLYPNATSEEMWQYLYSVAK